MLSVATDTDNVIIKGEAGALRKRVRKLELARRETMSDHRTAHTPSEPPSQRDFRIPGILMRLGRLEKASREARVSGLLSVQHRVAHCHQVDPRVEELVQRVATLEGKNRELQASVSNMLPDL